MSDRLTEIKARVAAYRNTDDPYFSVSWMQDDLEFALEKWTQQAATIEKLREALKGISKLGNLTLLGGSAMDSERAHEAGAHEAFSQAADIARSALGADYVQEG